MGRERCYGIIRRHKASLWLRVILCFILLLGVHAVVFAQQVARESPAGTKFWAYTPPSYSPSVAAPVLISLHGGSGIGDDLNVLTQQITGSQDNGHQTPARLIYNNLWNTSRPFIVISPQLKRDLSIPDYNDQEWPPALIDEVIEYVKTQYNVDATRIYITGISLGGAGTWSYATSYPDKVAAIIPFAGVARIEQACALTNVPIWVFHGENDGLVVPAFSINMINALNNCPNLTYKPRLTMIPAQAHEGWNGVFNGKHGYDIFSWLLKFKKGNTSNKAPHVSAMGNKKILLPGGAFFIPADYFDSDGTISSVVWEKVSGPSVVIDESNGPVLKISSLTTGVYTFRITVTDNGGLSSNDTMQLTVTAGEAVPQIMSLSLTDGNEVILRTLSNNDVINVSDAGGQINVMANTNASTRSIKFSVNAFDSIRTANLPNQSTSATLVLPQTSWKPASNEYYVCATPYSANAAGGTKGISLCYKLTIGSTTYYAKNNSDVSLLSSWGTNPDGSGSAPASFTSVPLNLIVPGTATVVTQTTVHELTKVTVKNGGSLNFQKPFVFLRNGNPFSITNINVEDNGTIRVNTDKLALNNFGANSTTIIESTANVGIPVAIYGNLILKGSGAKTFYNGATVTVRKKLTIEGNTPVNGSNVNDGEFLVLGDVEILGASNFVPTRPFSIRFGWAGTQALNLTPARSVFRNIKIGKGNVVNVTYAGMPGIVEINSTTSGELTILDNGVLKMNQGILTLKNDAAINPLNDKGTLDIQNASILLDVMTTRNSNLYAKRGAHTLKNLESNILGGAQLQIRDSLKIGEYLKASNGTIQSNGYLTLVSTPTSSAYIAPITGTGTVAGNVNIERTVEVGRKYKYFGFPVKNVTVAKLQESVPVTGPFPQSSTGPGLTNSPSMFYYNEPGEGWENFPVSQNSEVLELGRGYALFMRNETSPVKLRVSGPIHQGDFAFALTPDPDVDFDEEGWNLLGNPYAAPIEWKTTGWTRSGISNSVYVRDNSVEGGRFLVWDGTVGHEEFAGVISSGQAFWVRTTSTTPALSITEGAKVNRGDVIHYGVQEDEDVSFLKLDLRSGGFEDNVFLKFNDIGSFGFLTESDAMKQRNGYFNLSALTTDSVHTVIKNLPKGSCTYSIPLRFEGATSGAYTLSLSGTALGINAGVVTIYDRFTEKSTTINSDDEFSFTVNNDPRSSDINRLSLVINKLDAQPVVSVSAGTLRSDSETGNQWFLNGAPISGATNQTLEVTESGEYQLQVQRGSCSVMSAPVFVSITGVESDKNVKIYPNPASAEINIAGIPEQEASYTIHTISGAVAAKGTLSILERRCVVPVDQLAPGIYYLTLSQFPAKKWKVVIR